MADKQENLHNVNRTRPNEKRQGWRVGIRGDGERWQRFFADEKYGGPDASREAAIAYREWIFAEHQLARKGRFNTSSVVGVSRTSRKRQRDGKEFVTDYWQAAWQGPDGKQRTKRFNINKYGEDGAFELAKQARKAGVRAAERGLSAWVNRPEDPDTEVWRYMDFAKYVSLLEHRALFFTRVHCLDDPYEGAFSRANEKIRAFVYGRSGPSKSLDDVLADYKRQRENIAVSCWHMSEYESAAMWKLYSRSNEAVCIKSTVGRLSECFGPRVLLGAVDYSDYEQDWVPEDDPFAPTFRKRRSFSYEHELRAAVDLLDPENAERYGDRITDGGVYVPVNLNLMIRRIYVAPGAASWFADLVRRVTLQYGYKRLEVEHTALDKKPLR
jgi:hypothetical protein